jgi:hypothetical protein
MHRQESGTHQQCTRFHIHPRTNIPNQFHSSPEFVWRERSIYSSKPVPLWMKYASHPADIESCVIHVLETEVRKCDWYAANPENGDVVCISIRILYI